MVVSTIGRQQKNEAEPFELMFMSLLVYQRANDSCYCNLTEIDRHIYVFSSTVSLDYLIDHVLDTLHYKFFVLTSDFVDFYVVMLTLCCTVQGFYISYILSFYASLCLIMC